MSTAKEIFSYLRSYLDEWHVLQRTKDTYTLQQLNDIYYKFGKEYLNIREEIKLEIVKSPQLYREVKKLMSESLLFDMLIDGYSNDINRQGTNKDAILPLLPFPHQIELLHKLQFSRKHLHIQKSRRQGASVMTSYYMSWILKHEGTTMMFATHKDLKSLDGGLTDIARNSTLSRIRWYLDMSILMPDDWKNKRKYWTADNLEYHTAEKEIIIGGNSLAGAVLGKGTAVGFAGHVILVDELDVVCDMYPNQADAIFGSFATAVNRVILFSTYRGMDYPFYSIWEQQDTDKWDFVTLDWKDNPVCNIAWYEEQKAKMKYDEVLIARELDINPAKTRQGVIWDTITEENLKDLYIKQFPPMKYSKVIGADFGGGESATAFIFGYVEKAIGHLYLQHLLKTTHMDEYQIMETFRKYGFHGVSVFGDMSAMAQVGSPGHDWFNVLRKVGIKIIPVYNGDPHLVRNTIRLAFAHNEIFINKKELTLKRDLMSASYKKEKLDKNTHSHTSDALLYMYRKLFSADAGISLIDY